MSSWSVNNLGWALRVKPEGKGLQQTKIDVHNPLKSFEELEEKTGLKCSDERKKELIDNLEKDCSTNVPSWLDNIKVPEWYLTADKSDVINALNLGCKSITVVEKMNEKDVIENLKLQTQQELEKSKYEIEMLKNNHTKILTEVEERFAKQLAQKDKDSSDERERLNQIAISNLSSSGIDSKIEKIKNELNEQRERESKSWEQSREQFNKTIELLQVELAKAQTLQQQTQIKLEQKSERDAIMNISVKKGNLGEDMLNAYLRKAFMGSEIIQTPRVDGKVTNQMDTHLIWNNIKIMFDSKNHDGEDKNGYKECLKNKDLNKFRDNLRDSNDCSIGVLFCFHTYRSPYKYWVETNITDENKLEIYMNKVMDGDPVERLQLVACAIIQPWNEYLKKLEQNKNDNSMTEDDTKKWKDNAMNILKNGWTMISTLKQHWDVNSKVIKNALSLFEKELDCVVDKMNTELSEIGIINENGNNKDSLINTPKEIKSTAKKTKVSPKS
jgi:hypothetical protein